MASQLFLASISPSHYDDHCGPHKTTLFIIFNYRLILVITTIFTITNIIMIMTINVIISILLFISIIVAKVIIMMMIIIIYCNQTTFQLNTCATPDQSTRTECTEVQMLFLIITIIMMIDDGDGDMVLMSTMMVIWRCQPPSQKHLLKLNISCNSEI